MWCQRCAVDVLSKHPATGQAADEDKHDSSCLRFCSCCFQTCGWLFMKPQVLPVRIARCPQATPTSQLSSAVQRHAHYILRTRNVLESQQTFAFIYMRAIVARAVLSRTDSELPASSTAQRPPATSHSVIQVFSDFK